MKKIHLIILVILLGFSLSGCGEKETELEITPETVITMENLDDYMGRDDVQYVDLRNHAATLKYGYIYGFENIPFFEYLDYRAFNRERTYDFNPDQLLDTKYLTKFFEEEKAILLYADGCIRAGYIKDVLNHLGYERVYVIGGYYEYHGDNVVRGDGLYELGDNFYVSYYDSNHDVTFVMYGEYDVAFNIQSLRFDVLDEFKVSQRYDAAESYDEMLTIIEDYIDTNIYNFHEIVFDLDDLESELWNLEGIDWDYLAAVKRLAELEIR